MAWLCLLGLGINGCSDAESAPRANANVSRSAPSVSSLTQKDGLSSANSARDNSARDNSARDNSARDNSARDTSAQKERFRRALEPVLSRKADASTVRTNASGRKVISLHGGYGHAMMARRGASGKLEYGCFDDVEPAVEFVTSQDREVVR